jgi:hypothetical protein
MNNDLTKMIAEQLGFLMLTNIEQAGIITKLKEQVAKLEEENKALQDSNKYD